MDPEVKLLLQRNLKLAEDNNKMLHGMRRSARWGMLFKVVYWAVILGGAAYAFSYVTPYLDAVSNAYSALQGGTPSANQQQGSFPDFSKLLENFR